MSGRFCRKCECDLPPLNCDETNDFRIICEQCEWEEQFAREDDFEQEEEMDMDESLELFNELHN